MYINYELRTISDAMDKQIGPFTGSIRGIQKKFGSSSTVGDMKNWQTNLGH